MGLALENLKMGYGKLDVVKGVSLVIKPGEVVCLLGPSGCGKTSTLRAVAGLEDLRGGDIRVNGVVVASPSVHTPAEKRNVGLMLQDFALFPHLDVLANVSFGLSHLSAGEQKIRAMTLLERVGLVHKAHEFPHALSGGQQQRVALARALAPEPAVMLMDEPFSSLDVHNRADLRAHTRVLLKARGVPSLMVTHDPMEAMEMADRIAVMNDGVICQVGTPKELYDNPATAYVMEMFGPTHKIKGEVSGGKISTTFGAFDANGYKDHDMVDLVMRQTAYQIDPRGALSARVVDRRFHGEHAHLLLEMDEGGHQFEALLRDAHEVPSNDAIKLSVDHEQCRVFKAL